MRVGNHKFMYADKGFTYVVMLFALTMFGISLAALGMSWRAQQSREKEEALFEVGTAYANAIASYYTLAPGANKTFPTTLEDLTEDKRFVGVFRHIRRLYRDPITNSLTWGIIKTDDGTGITGVYSLNDKPVLHTQPIVINDNLRLKGAIYSDWKFVFTPHAP